jgi:hypothetical protein
MDLQLQPKAHTLKLTTDSQLLPLVRILVHQDSPNRLLETPTPLQLANLIH